MTNRILDFSESPARLHVHLNRLVVQRGDLPEVAVPLDELAVVVVSHPQVTYTQAVLSRLAEAGGSFVACNRRNLPVGMLLPLVGHHGQTERIAAQARAPRPVCKRLWRQIVRAKITAQARTLTELHGSDFGLRALLTQVRSGDPKNVEAQAARRYWPALFADKSFRRKWDRQDQNLLLNYGYAVLRAIVARAICAAGLHPSLGIHHHHRNNPFCLADDLMEPFRPTVDRAVAQYVRSEGPIRQVEPAAKRHVIAEITGRYTIDGQQRTLFDVAGRMAASLADVFRGKGEKIELPDW